MCTYYFLTHGAIVSYTHAHTFTTFCLLFFLFFPTFMSLQLDVPLACTFSFRSFRGIIAVFSSDDTLTSHHFYTITLLTPNTIILIYFHII